MIAKQLVNHDKRSYKASEAYVVMIRNAWEHEKNDPHSTYRTFAEKFPDMSYYAVVRIIKGKSHPKAGGPVDHEARIGGRKADLVMRPDVARYIASVVHEKKDAMTRPLLIDHIEVRVEEKYGIRYNRRIVRGIVKAEMRRAERCA